LKKKKKLGRCRSNPRKKEEGKKRLPVLRCEVNKR